MVVATVIAFVVGYAVDRLAAALRRAPQRLPVRLVPDRARRGAVRRARRGVDLGDLTRPHVGSEFVTTLILLRHGRVVGQRGRRAGRAHPRRGARRDGPGPGAEGRRAARRACRSPRSSARRCCAASRPSRRSPSDRGLRAGDRAGARRGRLRVVDRRRAQDAGQGAAVEGGAGAPVGRGVPRRGGAGRACRPARWPRSRRHDARIAAEHGPQAVWLACSHGDVIKSVLADALATHLDNFQRIVVDPCSISVVHYTADPAVRRAGQRPRRRRRGPRPAGAEAPAQRRHRRSSDAVVGGAPGRSAGGDSRRAAIVPLRRAGRGWRSTLGWRHVTRHPCLPPARALRRRDRRRARRPLLLPAGDRGRPHGQRAAGEAAGLGARRAHQRPAQEVTRRFGADVPEAVAGDPDLDPLAVPLEEEFRVGTMGLGWDADSRIDRRRAARGHRGGGRRVGRPRRHRGGPRRAAGVPLPGAGQGVRRARRAGRLGRAPAVPAVRRAARPGRATSASGSTATTSASPVAE